MLGHPIALGAHRLGLVCGAGRKYNKVKTAVLEECFMHSNNRNESRAARVRGFAALFAIMLAVGLGLMASPAGAAPFAYVTNGGGGTVSVIDTPTNKVVGTPITVGTTPAGVAVTPDGKHVYVTNSGVGTVSVIDTATNTVAATIPVGNGPEWLAVTPDGTHAYVANGSSNTVSVIATASNTVVATVPVGNTPEGIAVSPDGKHVYVANLFSNNVSVIDTASKTVVATVGVGTNPKGIAITPDGKHAYVANRNDSTVSVIDTATNTVEAATITVGLAPYGVAVTPDGTQAYVANIGSADVSVIGTASNTVVATVPVGSGPIVVAVTPDGKRVYVANHSSNTVSVIATATNMVVGKTITVGANPNGVGIVPAPPGVPFLAFSATQLGIAFGAAPNTDSFNLQSLVTISSTSIKGINLHTQAVTLQVGTFTTIIPPGSFTKQPDGSYIFVGVIDGVSLEVVIEQAVTLRYRINVTASGASLTGTKNSVYVTLIIGGNSGAASVTAAIQGQASPL
jgi:YVTN family beta-propeller protein